MSGEITIVRIKIITDKALLPLKSCCEHLCEFHYVFIDFSLSCTRALTIPERFRMMRYQNPQLSFDR